MTTYVVMAPPEFEDLTRSPEQSDRLKFVPDRFSGFAFIFSIVWLLVHRMWLVLLGYLALTLVIELFALSFGPEAMSIAALAVALVFGFEAQNLRCWSLARKGWRMVGITEGRDPEEAEARFFHSVAEDTPSGTTFKDRQSRQMSPDPIVPRIGSEQVVGLTLGPETRQ